MATASPKLRDKPKEEPAIAKARAEYAVQRQQQGDESAVLGIVLKEVTPPVVVDGRA